MIRVVIDTNCLRASIPPKSPFYQLYLDFTAGKFEWYVSNEILLEYDEILTRTYSHNTAQFVLYQLAVSPNVVYSEPAFRWNLIENDPDDNKFSDLAISSNCDYLVTNDTDFNVFKTLPFPRLTVIDLQSFLKITREL
ncbi:putative toxin-antitoxin system toxin component, PIN family [Dyadobacter sp. CY343]|uniref:putative toxin-antitoxin system toxin component, PIN family n=1 Tax=Dyadobacter sp. CY343 TaxID=2907299 RepID=UPI001F41989D|nr:putative toxin-antitoxin system toxin component, PIN family [Dyadobacter sp. CY343]MCE7058913.1 putative toxin-antitoxin system toxin component, PIN family [Dyadobacter sp. CY343]